MLVTIGFLFIELSEGFWAFYKTATLLDPNKVALRIALTINPAPATPITAPVICAAINFADIVFNIDYSKKGKINII